MDDVISMVQDHNPDVAAISEANMRAEVDQHMNFIPGYNISTVKDFIEEGVSRLVVLTKEGLNFKLLSEKMEAGIASIWLSFVRKGKKPFIVGAIYREHKILMGRNAGQNMGQTQVGQNMGQNMAQNMGQVRMGQNLGQAYVGQNRGHGNAGHNMGHGNAGQNMGQAQVGQNMGQNMGQNNGTDTVGTECGTEHGTEHGTEQRTC